MISDGSNVLGDSGYFFEVGDVFVREDFFEFVEDDVDVVIVVCFGNDVVFDVIDMGEGVKGLFGFFMSFRIS